MWIGDGFGVPTVIDLMRFHIMERKLYARLTRCLRQDPDRCKTAIALWLWLESIGYHDFMRHIYSYSDQIVLEFLREALLCVEAIVNASVITDENSELELMSRQVNEPMDLRFFDFNRERAREGVVKNLTTICNVIFDETLQRQTEAVEGLGFDEVARAMPSLVQTVVLGGPDGTSYIIPPPVPPTPVTPTTTTASTMAASAASSSSAGAGTSGMSLPAVLRSNLNPMARPWSPSVLQSSEDQRSMFITFSKGHPISREDIMDFFTARYGPCVECVMIEKVETGATPMYGRVVFTSASMIAIVLNGQRTAKFMINGKHLWARMYVPRHGSSSSSAGASSSGGASSSRGNN